MDHHCPECLELERQRILIEAEILFRTLLDGDDTLIEILVDELEHRTQAA